MQCVILAGGLGTRIFPLTEEIPKNLIDINGKPFAHYQLSLLANNGITEVIYCLGYLGNKIKDYVGDGSCWSLNVKYVNELENNQNRLVGTGGALRLAYDLGLLKEKFFIIYGDSFTPVNFKEVMNAYDNQTKPLLMTLLHNKNKFDRSNVMIDENNSVIYNKDNYYADYIDYGLTITNANCIKENVLEKCIYQLPDLYKKLCSITYIKPFNYKYREDIFPFIVNQRFYEIGSFQGIQDFKEWVSKNENDNP